MRVDDDDCPFREGVVVDRNTKKGAGAFVDIGKRKVVVGGEGRFGVCVCISACRRSTKRFCLVWLSCLSCHTFLALCAPKTVQA